MKVNKEELRIALEIVKPALGSNETVEQTTSFAFMNDKIVTYNNKISISHPINLNIEGAINAIELYQFISKISNEEVDLEWERDQIIIKAGRNKVGLVIESEIKLPIEEVGKISQWKDLPEDFIEGLSFSLIACSNNESKPIITCIHIREDGFIESTDNHRAIQYKLRSSKGLQTVLIPGEYCKEVIKLNPTKIAYGEGWVHFKTKLDTIISCRTFKATFPDISKIIEVRGESIEMPQITNKLIDKAMIFTDTDIESNNKAIQIIIDNGVIIVKGKSSLGSWFEGRGRVKYNGKLISFSIIPNLLKDILERTNSLVIGKNKLKFESDNWIYITLLMI